MDDDGRGDHPFARAVAVPVAVGVEGGVLRVFVVGMGIDRVGHSYPRSRSVNATVTAIITTIVIALSQIVCAVVRPESECCQRRKSSLNSVNCSPIVASESFARRASSLAFLASAR